MDRPSPPSSLSLVDRFAELATLATGEREAALAVIAGEDPAQAAELRELLAHHDQASGFLDGDFVGGASAPPALRPESIGGFRILGELGWGGMGVVYLAEQERPRREVALKVLRWDRQDRVAVKRFEREAEILGRLEHQNLARVYAAGVDTVGGVPVPWFAMERIDGVPIDRACANWPWARILETVADAADGVQVAHAAGVVHRDLKPSNLFVTAQGRAVVLDFGIAAVSGDSRATLLTHSGHIVGTLATMSPEQASGRSELVDARTDVYALGVVLYELLAGHPPIDVAGVDAATAVARIERVAVPRLRRTRPDLPADLEILLQAALSKAADLRPSSAGELADDLRRIVEGRPIRARVSTRWQRLRAAVRRHRTWVGSIAAVIVVLAVALGVTLSSLRQVRALNRELALGRALDRAEVLESRAERLWPAQPELLPEFDAWLAEAEEVRAALVEFLAAPRDRERPLGESPPRGLASAAVARDLFDPERRFGGYSDVRQRRAEALAAYHSTIEVPADAWRAAIERIASGERYGGLALVPQLGLVPLGPDPVSGLEEFAVWGRAGAVPRRDPATGELWFTGHSTLVLVLVPGGEFWFGRQSDNPSGPNFDPDALAHEWLGERSRLVLDPFLISKFEVTQGQFERVMGFNTSYWRPGEGHAEVAVDARHPVESVRHGEARLFCDRTGLTLPTEAQFEFAMRAGSRTRYWWGDGVEGGLGLEARPGVGPEVTWSREDGSIGRWRPVGLHAPVGVHGANGFGLCDMAGNVAEWCLEEFWGDRSPGTFAPGTGAYRHPDGEDPFGPHYVVRGGGHGSLQRSGMRNELFGREAKRDLGFRVVRALRDA